MSQSAPFGDYPPHGAPRQAAPVVFPWPSLIWGLVALAAFVIAIVSLPRLVESITAAARRGPERVAAEEARAALADLDIKSLSAGFELIPKAVAPSVVHINVRQRRNVPDALAEFFQNRQVAGQGSGAIVDEEGYIVTNHHVVQGASDIQVRLSDGTVLVGQRVGTDPLFDLAVVKVDAGRPLTAIPWGDSDELVPGSLVWALGSPFGLDHSVTFGIVSATERSGLNQNPFQDYLQTDAAVNPGNSGGPLVNLRGELVGVNTAIVGESYQGVSFSLPSNKVRKVYEQLRERGVVQRGYLGVRMRDVTPRDAQILALPDATGVLIEGVEPGTPADEAGLQRNDVIVAWNGTETPARLVLSRLVAETAIGSEAEVEFYRRGRKQSATLTVGLRPDDV